MRTLAITAIALFFLSLPGQGECGPYNCENNPPCENDAYCLGDCFCDEGYCVSYKEGKTE